MFQETRRNHEAPSTRARSKQLKDREHLERRQERLLLFGYVKLKNGEVITIGEAATRLKGRLTENPNGRIQPIVPDDIAEWHQPETFTDCVNSIGEVDALGMYPALQVSRGDVLRDPKIRVRGVPYIHPALRHSP